MDDRIVCDTEQSTETDQVGLCGRGEKRVRWAGGRIHKSVHILLEREEWVDFHSQGKSFMALEAENAADQVFAHMGTLPALRVWRQPIISERGAIRARQAASRGLAGFRGSPYSLDARPPRLRTALMNFFCKKTYACRSSSNACPPLPA